MSKAVVVVTLIFAIHGFDSGQTFAQQLELSISGDVVTSEPENGYDGVIRSGCIDSEGLGTCCHYR